MPAVVLPTPHGAYHAHLYTRPPPPLLSQLHVYLWYYNTTILQYYKGMKGAWRRTGQNSALKCILGCTTYRNWSILLVYLVHMQQLKLPGGCIQCRNQHSDQLQSRWDGYGPFSGHFSAKLGLSKLLYNSSSSVVYTALVVCWS